MSTDWSQTIQAKSDQLNAEDLLTGPRVIVVTGAVYGSPDQPMVIHYQNDNGKPYKPSKTMRKIILGAWGDDDTQWIGRGMTIFNEPTVKWAGKPCGGINISHMSHINKALEFNLTVSRGKKKIYKIGILS